MSRRRDARPEFVVEATVEGIAVRTIRAESAEAAEREAVDAILPADVVELAEVDVLYVVKVGDPVPPRRRRPLRWRLLRRSKAGE